MGCGTTGENGVVGVRGIYAWSGKHGVEGAMFIGMTVGCTMGLYLGTPTYTQGINILVIVENGSV